MARMTIRVTKALPGEDHPLSRREDFIGLILVSDTQAAAMIRKEHPHLPKISNTFEVALGDVLEALVRANRFTAMTYWANVPCNYLFRIPHNCAEVIETVASPAQDAITKESQ